MIVMNSFCFAMPSINKSETVYVNLGEEGNVSEINIYSILTNNTAENYEDYTKYTKVENLTNRKNIESGEEKTIFNVSGERRVAYTGKVGEEYYDKLPWIFKITYKLNGVECAQKDLLGAKGLVEIVLEINTNENAKEYYKNNYMLEITGSYDMDDYLSLESDEAIIANTGNTKTLMFIVLPGQSTTLHIKLGTENFSMDGITMAMVPITGSILDELSDLVDEKENIENAKDAINASTDVILNSLKGMNNGLNGINNGVTEIKNGTKEIHGLSGLRDEDIAKLKTILEELEPIIENTNKDLDSMKTNYEIFVEMSEKISEKAKNLEENVDDLNDRCS
jgi:putative membrane protein